MIHDAYGVAWVETISGYPLYWWDWVNSSGESQGYGPVNDGGR